MAGRRWKTGAVCVLIVLCFGLACGVHTYCRFAGGAGYLIQTTRREERVEQTRTEEDGWPESLLPGERIDLNTAPVADLERLPGIGEVKAQAIADWRAEHGPFQHPQELMEVYGIGEKIYESLRDYITVH